MARSVRDDDLPDVSNRLRPVSLHLRCLHVRLHTKYILTDTLATSRRLTAHCVRQPRCRTNLAFSIFGWTFLDLSDTSGFLNFFCRAYQAVVGQIVFFRFFFVGHMWLVGYIEPSHAAPSRFRCHVIAVGTLCFNLSALGPP